MRVMIAEDDATSRSILSAVLKKWGYDPVITQDGSAAWDALQQADPPKLLLIDWDMPKLDGIALCRRIREGQDTNPPYIILLTGRDHKGDTVKGLDAGANDYIAKPYDNEELWARMRVGQRMLELQDNLAQTLNALEYQAMHDPLTGTYNRRAILERLKAELKRAKRNNSALSIGMFDIDHFKLVNDRYGHPVGDEVLIAFTQTIQSGLRAYDVLGRVGGEEFLVIAAGSNEYARKGLYVRLCEQVADRKIETQAGILSITVSIGAAPATGDAAMEDLVAAADKALYAAKEQGRNRVVCAGAVEGSA